MRRAHQQHEKGTNFAITVPSPRPPHPTTSTNSGIPTRRVESQVGRHARTSQRRRHTVPRRGVTSALPSVPTTAGRGARLTWCSAGGSRDAVSQPPLDMSRDAHGPHARTPGEWLRHRRHSRGVTESRHVTSSLSRHVTASSSRQTGRHCLDQTLVTGQVQPAPTRSQQGTTCLRAVFLAVCWGRGGNSSDT